MRASTFTQLPLFQPDSDWNPPEVLPSLQGITTAAIDIETYDPSLAARGPGWPHRDGRVVGVAVATDAWSEAVYLPITHQGGNNLDRTIVYGWLQELLDQNITFVMHNAMYDIGWLEAEGLRFPYPVQDTMLAAALLDENRMSYSLDSLGKTYCNAQKDEVLLKEAAAAWGVKAKEGMWRLPSQFVGPYAEQDAALTLRLWRVLEEALKNNLLWDLYQLEVGLLPMLIKMRKRGLRVSEDRAIQVADQLNQKSDELVMEIARKSGHKQVDLYAAKSLAVLFEKVGVTYNFTPTGLPSFQAVWLESHEHWLPKLVVRARKYQRAASTFIDQYILGHTVNGRIHAEMHPLRSDEGGTVSGRFSFSNPPLQQMPARDPELGPLIRSIFLPEDGTFWGAYDYSQQEPRLTVHYAALLGLDGAEEALGYYANDPSADFHRLVAEMAGIERSEAKIINLGLAYGMGKGKLADSLQLDSEAAEALFKQYHDKVPFVKLLTDACSNRASSVGYIRTLLGRKCRFDKWEPADRKRDERIVPVELWKARKSWGNRPLRRAYTHKALNRLIQGSAADQTKKAMLDMYKEGIIPLLQMHDELDVATESAAQARKISEIMRDTVQLKVPMKVDCELGENWGEAKKSISEIWPE